MTRFGVPLVLAVTLPLCWAEKDPASFKFGKVEREVLEETRCVEEAFREQGVLLEDRPLEEWLTRIGAALTGQQLPLENVTFRFAALRDPIPNVIALPNGSIYITTGMLATLENEEQLAGLMAQGISEIANRQTYTFLRAFRKKTMIQGLVLAPLPGSFLFTNSIMARLRGGPGVQAALVSGYGERLAQEAGLEALKRMHSAGYDPQALPQALYLLADGADPGRSRFRYQSHTSLLEREQALRECAAKLSVHGASGRSVDGYLAHAGSAITVNIHTEIAGRNPRAALIQARRLVSWDPQEPRYQLLLAYSLLAVEDHRQAESIYRRIIDREPSLVDAHRGLGLLLEKESRKDEAAAEYRHYLDHAPTSALERRRIEHRLAMLATSANVEAAALKRACVVPADVQVKRSWVEDAEALSRQTTAWQEQLTKLVESKLNQAGVEIVPFRSTAMELLEVRREYTQLADKLEKRSKDVEKGQFTIDDAVAVLPCAAAADTIVFLQGRSEAVGKTMRMGWDGAATLQISFADARSGGIFAQVLVYGDGTTSDTVSVLGQDLEKCINKVKKQRCLPKLPRTITRQRS
ncbi:tetratricopeptide repeat protein [uncultured Paludibaculum sp.]|uniref:tetratricopeptide repeat protein n=1 Tax=uncultured Paludibaculum sp. TaxID=1765020 RepID=UPI002AAC1E4E|nr:tetratricopeptide repeat protein [uncultured Paludibaculum sp.]